MTGSWGSLNEINNLSGRESGIMDRTFLDNLRSCLKRSTGQSFLSWSKQARNASADLSALPVFLGTVSVKDTPSRRTLQCLRSRDAKAEIRSGQVNTNRVTNFTEIVLRDRVLFFPKEKEMNFGGRLLRAPLRSSVT